MTKQYIYVPCKTDPPKALVTDMVMVHNSSSAGVSWTSLLYNCSLIYISEGIDEENVSVYSFFG